MSAEARVIRASAVILFSTLLAPALQGQAWIAPSGESSVALTFQRTEFEGHFFYDGSRIPHGGSHSRSLALGIEHSLTDKFAISASVPYVGSENGIDPQPVLGRDGIDDGNYHSTWQDFRLGARYNVLDGPVVLTPLVALRIPTHNYPTIGEAAVGPDLRELQLGVDAGHLFAARNVYIDAEYAYAIVQKFKGVSMNRSNVDVEFGYFVFPRLTVRALINWQKTYGGLTTDHVFATTGPPFRNPDLPDALWLAHDRLLRDDYWRAGAGATYSMTPTVSTSFTFVKPLRGTNSHYGYLYAIGFSRTFSPK